MTTTMRYPKARAAAILGPLTVAALLQLNPGASQAQTLVRDLDNPARQPFQAELQRLRVPTSGVPEIFQVAQVPAGKRLVIEHVSFRIRSLEATAGGAPQPRFRSHAVLGMKADGVPAQHELVVSRADAGAASINIASQPIRAYADPGSPVFVQIECRNDNGQRNSLVEVLHLAVSGHLVDL
jgi:hypothetical protein